jgi:3(or 17)beta-hydroxysteroid dehydrogenase
MGRLNGKVALITGGASGMGAETVRHFLAEGARVVFSDIQREQGEALARNTGATFLEHDVADEAAWRRVMEEIATRYSRLDIVFNNAGIVGIPRGVRMSIEEIDLATYQRLVAVNQTSVLLGCQQAIARMRRNPGGPSGSIINTGSTSGILGNAADVAYSGTKAAVHLMTKAIAVHCARAGLNIRCNAIAPGSIDTAIYRTAIAAMPAMREAVERMSPLGRLGSCAEVAAVATFLASDESSYCTGGIYLVDGGLTAGHPGV